LPGFRLRWGTAIPAGLEFEGKWWYNTLLTGAYTLSYHTKERRVHTVKRQRGKILWLICMVMLCLVLYMIVLSRMDNTTKIIFGGVDGAYVSSDKMSFADPNANTPEPTVDIWPKIDITMHQYTMVRDSKNNLLSAVYEPEVEEIPGETRMFDKSAMPYLLAMLEDCRAAGHTVMVTSAYRSYSYQTKLFNGKASQIALGFGVDDYLDPEYQKAVDEARTIVAFPGSSEHQLGLAVDLMDKNYSRLVYEEMDQELFAWLDEHCAEYGFIKRYPTRKLLLTGWDEPWHYRYVGVEAATFIMENGLSYEEFYAHYDKEFVY